MLNDSLYSHDGTEWETPDNLFAGLDIEFRFTLDVAASEHNAKCDKYLSIQDDGLSQPWSGVCWMNPPYGRAIGKWMDKAHAETKRGVTTVALVPARTDTRWWHRTAMLHEMRFLSKRLSFKGGKSKAPFPSVVVVFRPCNFCIADLKVEG